MILGDYFKNIKNNYKNFFFTGISFDSSQIKKNYIFLQSKEIEQMVIILYLQQSIMVQK